MDLSPEQRNRLRSLLKGNSMAQIHQNAGKITNSSILIVDGNNLFLRGFMAVNSMNSNGDLTGGIVASLKSMGYAIKMLTPTRVIVVFDGVGGSYKRRKIYPEYKSGRKGKIRLNRTYEDDGTPSTEEENCRRQYVRFIQYLQTLPLNMLSIDHAEADDVIAYLATQHFKDSSKVIIMSSDKDFLQLCGNNVVVYSPTKKRIYGVPEVLADYNIHPNNFVLFRAMDGDKSDGVDGIDRAGLKTIVKYFPWLNEENVHTIDEIVTRADGLKNKYKVCQNICEGKSILERNFALMQLKETLLTTTAQLHIEECLDTKKIPRLDRNLFFKMVREDMMDNNFDNHVQWITDVWGALDSVVR